MRNNAVMVTPDAEIQLMEEARRAFGRAYHIAARNAAQIVAMRHRREIHDIIGAMMEDIRDRAIMDAEAAHN